MTGTMRSAGGTWLRTRLGREGRYSRSLGRIDEEKTAAVEAELAKPWQGQSLRELVASRELEGRQGSEGRTQRGQHQAQLVLLAQNSKSFQISRQPPQGTEVRSPWSFAGSS